VKRIAHISDLHFGRDDPAITLALLGELTAEPPSLLAVSGDLTQRARRREFEAARRFLDAIPAPKVVVPGNHDIPLFDVVRRLLSPFGRYERHVSRQKNPFVELEGLAVLGVNTARPSTWKDGRLSLAQIETVRTRLCAVPADDFKVLVTHHPFLPPPTDPAPAIVGRGLSALVAAESCGVDLLLAGHLHRGYTGDARTHHVTLRRSILVAQAGTAISRRTRGGEANSYNLIRIAAPRLEIEVRRWDGGAFRPERTARFEKVKGVWLVVD
jgi:3',5'-cyclic AMP phosphodiesterase CpdA